MSTSFYTETELQDLGFRSIGEDVLISRKTSLYSPETISIGNHVRIDDFCILSGNIEIHDYVHIAAYAALYGGSAGILLDDFSGLSARTVIYAASDDYSGLSLTNPTVPNSYRNVSENQVHLEKHASVGSGCTILPGVTIKQGSAVGSMSLVTKSLEEFGIYAGIPVKKIKDRERKLLELEVQFKCETERNRK